MSGIVFLNGKNFHIEKSGEKLIIYYEDNGSCFKVEVLDKQISEPIKIGEFEEIIKLSDGRYVKRVNDLIVIVKESKWVLIMKRLTSFTIVKH